MAVSKATVREAVSLTVDKPTAEDRNYPGGESDVLNANRVNNFTYEELVSIVHCTGDTVFPFDLVTSISFFDVIDADVSGSVSFEEILAARDNTDNLTYVEQCHSPALTTIFTKDESTVARILAKYCDESGELTKEAWLQFMLEQQESRMIYFRAKMMALGKVSVSLFFVHVAHDCNWNAVNSIITGKDWNREDNIRRLELLEVTCVDGFRIFYTTFATITCSLLLLPRVTSVRYTLLNLFLETNITLNNYFRSIYQMATTFAARDRF
jgi:hypothetical protein